MFKVRRCINAPDMVDPSLKGFVLDYIIYRYNISVTGYLQSYKVNSSTLTLIPSTSSLQPVSSLEASVEQFDCCSLIFSRIAPEAWC